LHYNACITDCHERELAALGKANDSQLTKLERLVVSTSEHQIIITNNMQIILLALVTLLILVVAGGTAMFISRTAEKGSHWTIPILSPFSSVVGIPSLVCSV
jgi:hypothetical protein